MRWMAPGLLALLLLLPSPATAAVLVGEVVGVTDGDTIRVLDAEKRQHRVRLQGIDTPERHQDWYQRARQALASRVHRQVVEVHWNEKDRWGRILGKVLIADPTCREDCPRTWDVNLALVREGHAWWFRRYAHEQTPADRVLYEAAEARAREAKIGLWSLPDPVPPWDFRRKKKKRR